MEESLRQHRAPWKTIGSFTPLSGKVTVAAAAAACILPSPPPLGRAAATAAATDASGWCYSRRAKREEHAPG